MFHSNYVPILNCFPDIARYWSKIADLNLEPPVFGAPTEEYPIGISLRFLAPENYIPSTGCTILRLTILDQCRLVTDEQMDRQTDGHMTTAYTTLT